MMTRMILAAVFALAGAGSALALPPEGPLNTTGSSNEMGIAMVTVVDEGGQVLGVSISVGAGDTPFDRQVMGTVVGEDWAIGTRVTTGTGECTSDIAQDDFTSLVADCELIGAPSSQEP